MKKQMGSMGGAPQAQIELPKTDIRKIGRSDNVNGYAYEYYESFSNGQKEAEFCVASWDDIDASENMRNSFIAMSEMMEGFLN